MTDLIYTVEHTGTTSLLEQVDYSMTQYHCGDLPPDRVLKFATVYTTYRDPYRVGASWANRYGHLDDRKFRRWCRQWKVWAEIDSTILNTDDLKYKANAFGDENGMHEALDNDNLELYHEYVPEKFITFAQDCVRKRGIN